MALPVTDITVSGAYGRDYKSLAAMKADWEANKDFENRSMYPGAYINKADVTKYQRPQVWYRVWGRYKRLTEVGLLQK